MPYLIDGHNLIPKLGLRLDEPDDELELVRLLQDFARITRHPVEVYFDGAPAGQAGMRKIGMIKAHFVRLGQTADTAIRKRLESMGKSARNWSVVSSDREVQAIVKANKAVTIRSEEFVDQLRASLSAGQKSSQEETQLSKQEVEEWLRIFKQGR
ncbi:MAG: NYN domain-containing protein [Anaerolineales bacterium]|nr:NYN domain-containing protein [Anaerolineales bacterium]MCK6582591.1 NYN domain-containing protein [Anaerolineales bacterium]